MNTESILETLTEDQRAELRRLLESCTQAQALAQIAQPPPVGLRLQMSRSTLCRLKKQFELEDQLVSRECIDAQVNALASHDTGKKLIGASLQLLKERAFQLTLSTDPAALRLAGSLLLCINRLEPSCETSPASSQDPILTKDLRREITRDAIQNLSYLQHICASEELTAPERNFQFSGASLSPESTAG